MKSEKSKIKKFFSQAFSNPQRFPQDGIHQRQTARASCFKHKERSQRIVEEVKDQQKGRTKVRDLALLAAPSKFKVTELRTLTRTLTRETTIPDHEGEDIPIGRAKKDSLVKNLTDHVNFSRIT